MTDEERELLIEVSQAVASILFTKHAEQAVYAVQQKGAMQAVLKENNKKIEEQVVKIAALADHIGERSHLSLHVLMEGARVKFQEESAKKANDLFRVVFDNMEEISDEMRAEFLKELDGEVTLEKLGALLQQMRSEEENGR